MGNVYCWGHNQYGGIGDGTYQNRGAPTAVLVALGGAPLTGVVQIGAGSDFTCARLMSGAVECWGWNQDGELGDGTNMSSPSPVVATVTSNAQDLAVGGEHVCVRIPDGNIQCWGNNTFGEAPNRVAW
jgi:alpha-tubulin suppressor-like RCC1 family protein